MDEDMSPRSDCLGLNVLTVLWWVSVDGGQPSLGLAWECHG